MPPRAWLNWHLPGDHMVALIRLLVLALVGGFAVCMLMHKTTGDAIWRKRAMEILKWGVVLGLLAFGGVILRRAAVFI
jgi:hypothetical protein